MDLGLGPVRNTYTSPVVTLGRVCSLRGDTTIPQKVALGDYHWSRHALHTHGMGESFSDLPTVEYRLMFLKGSLSLVGCGSHTWNIVFRSCNQELSLRIQSVVGGVVR